MAYLVGFREFEEIQSIRIPLVDDIPQGLPFKGPALIRVSVHLHAPWNLKTEHNTKKGQ